MTLFALPRPVELGEGWSLRFLTAAEMLACRTEGEAKASEERDKALWANAALLARVLLREGEPAFPDGEAVLSGLTVGQIDGLTRRWWAQDDFSGDSPSRVSQEEWGTRERSENEHFDMVRYLALGGATEPPHRDPAGEELISVRPSALSGFPEVWPGLTLPMRDRAAGQRLYREPYLVEGMDIPYRTGTTAPAEVGPSLPRKGAGTEEPQREETAPVKVRVTEAVRAGQGLTVEELDRAVERDARRYDGGSTLL